MLKFIQPQNMNSKVYFEDISSCPICNSKISPIYLSGQSHFNKNTFSLYCECPSCGKPFVAYFSVLCFETFNNKGNYIAKSLEYLAPTFPCHKEFDEHISSLSPNFVETYNQSLSAEVYNLNQIAGMGYRKALEFLIKDYCIYKNPPDNEKIVKMLLGNCINTYIEDINIKNLAKVSAWLGNDETHYIRKFEDRDITDLKRFIDTTVYFILYNLNVDEANKIISSN